MGDTRSVTGQNYDDSVTRYICCPEFVPSMLKTLRQRRSILMFSSRQSTPHYYGYQGGDDIICSAKTTGVWHATATDSDLPARTSITTFWDGAYDTVTARPILVAWQAKDKDVLAALAERGEEPFWPPAWDAEKAAR